MTRGVVLWIVAVAVGVFAGVWQRRTGPSYPWRGRLVAGGVEAAVSLPRSHVTTSPARVALPAPGAGMRGTLYWRRYPSGDAFAGVAMRAEGDTLAAALPVQAPAQMVEYYAELASAAGETRIVPPTGRAVVLRWRDPIPSWLLISHITVMMLALVLGARAGLAAAFEGDRYRLLALLTLAAIALGGLVLGPATERAAFGTWWTGLPFGRDVTDDKTLLAFVAWVAAVYAGGRRWRRAPALVLLACVVMLAVYLIPHSVAGSRLQGY